MKQEWAVVLILTAAISVTSVLWADVAAGCVTVMHGDVENSLAVVLTVISARRSAQILEFPEAWAEKWDTWDVIVPELTVNGLVQHLLSEDNRLLRLQNLGVLVVVM